MKKKENLKSAFWSIIGPLVGLTSLWSIFIPIASAHIIGENIFSFEYFTPVDLITKGEAITYIYTFLFCSTNIVYIVSVVMTRITNAYYKDVSKINLYLSFISIPTVILFFVSYIVFSNNAMTLSKYEYMCLYPEAFIMAIQLLLPIVFNLINVHKQKQPAEEVKPYESVNNTLDFIEKRNDEQGN